MVDWQNPAARVGINDIASCLKNGRITAVALVEASFAAINRCENGRAAFVAVNGDEALMQAYRWDAKRKTGQAVPQFAGVPISIKDIFDVEGQVTSAGSTILPSTPARNHAIAIQRLVDLGFIVLGRTHMTEFAYSGLGLNCHFAEPDCVWDPTAHRVPGGSSSGAAVATALGAGLAGIGTDTGGSCRIPASFNRLVGFKPTARRIPLDGLVPLSPSLDSIGVIGRTVECAATLVSVMADETLSKIQPSRSGKLLIPENYFFDEIDGRVVATFQRKIHQLKNDGVRIERKVLRSLERVTQLNLNGGIVAAESYRWHRELLEKHASDYDPRVRIRIERGKSQADKETDDRYKAREAFIREFELELEGYDALLVPTTPVVPPRKLECLAEDDYTRLNALVLRNPMIANLADGCSITLPIGASQEPPIGLMLIGRNGADSSILAWAAALQLDSTH
jgi:aspartyl-tRNA(Asn)/glutamyl-tRNA(Gln) amidotransferase subunit A